MKGIGFRFARWFYRKFFERRLWRFMAILKEFFLADTARRLCEIEGRINDIEQRLCKLEWNMSSQWDPLEQLLLALFRQPLARNVNAQPDLLESERAGVGEVNQVNGPHSIC